MRSAIRFAVTAAAFSLGLATSATIAADLSYDYESSSTQLSIRSSASSSDVAASSNPPAVAAPKRLENQDDAILKRLSPEHPERAQSLQPRYKADPLSSTIGADQIDANSALDTKSDPNHHPPVGRARLASADSSDASLHAAKSPLLNKALSLSPAEMGQATQNRRASYNANPSQGTFVRGMAPPRPSTTNSANSQWQNEMPAPRIALNNSPSSSVKVPSGQPMTGEVIQSTPEPISMGEPIQIGDESSQCDSTCDGCCSCFNPCGPCGWYGDVEYLLVRPTFSNQSAFVKQTTTNVTDPVERTTTTEQIIRQDYGYNSSIRTSLGYRTCCGGEIRFTYWNFGGDFSQDSGPAVDDSVIYAGHLLLVTQEPGQHIFSEGHLNMNVYDIDYIKCSSNSCGQCNCCSPWALRYSAGIRIADFSRLDNSFLRNEDGSGVSAAFISNTFVGAGPRLGAEGRRFFGDCNCASLYARGNLSLLVGQYDLKETKRTPPVTPNSITNYFDSHDRVIPVAEIELGGSWQYTQNITLSAGYMFQAWWDLGAPEQIEGNAFANPSDSNILSFDGLVARIEICF